LKKIRIIAIISAVITAVAVYIYLSGLNKPVEIQKFPAVVATVQIKEGTEIKPEMVSVKMLPADAIVDRAAASVDEVVGRISSTNVEAGEQLLVARFYKSGETSSGLAIAVEKGKRAFTVAVDSVTGVAGLIRPRDTVDVLLVIGLKGKVQKEDDTNPEDGQTSDITIVYSKILLQNIKVLATGQTIVPGSDVNEPKTVDTVTLSVTPEQAVELNLAASEGKIRLVLRSPIDTDTTDTDDVIVDDIVKEILVK
jgi:pilus assembly protein CpaB